MGLEEETKRTFRDWTVHMAGEPLQRQRKRFAFDKLQKAFDEEVTCLKELQRRATVARHTCSKRIERDEESGFDEPLDKDISPRGQATVATSDSLKACHE